MAGHTPGPEATPQAPIPTQPGPTPPPRWIGSSSHTDKQATHLDEGPPRFRRLRLVHQYRPASCTRIAICTRLLTSSLAMRRETCALTVASLMKSEAAISAFEAPSPSAVATS